MCSRISILMGVLFAATAINAHKLEPARPLANHAPATNPFESDIKPLLSSYCFGCHGHGKKKGDVALDQWRDESEAARELDTWQRVLKKVQDGEMPPENKPQPSAAERARLAKWIEAAVFQCDCEHPDAGRAPIRRLNRAEYNNTIRDLLGVDFKPADDFPVDDSGYGFDNMADALSLSPVLFEKYLAASEKIVNAAFVLNAAAPPVTTRFTVDGLEVGYNARQRGDGWVFLNSVEEDDVAVDFESPVAGEYAVRVRAYAIQQGSNAMRLTFMLGAQLVRDVLMATNSESPRVYEARMKLAAGRNRVRAVVRRIKDGLPEAQALQWKSGPQQKGAVLLQWLEMEGPLAIDTTLPKTHRDFFTTQSQIGTDGAVARDLLGRFARRAFRRPVSGGEVERLVDLARTCWKRGDTFEQGVARAVQAVLVSPQFLFRTAAAVESATNLTARADARAQTLGGRRRDQDVDAPLSGAPARNVPVDEFTLASRLSYFLWSTMPDGRLFELADRNQLRANLESEVRRMLGSAKARALVDNFAGQWLQLRNLELVAPDKTLFPDFDEELRLAMRRETEMFFANVWQADRSILEFLDADYTYVNERLARHYGLRGITGPEFQRVSLQGTTRRGLLTQASVLALTSNPTRTSPVKRGKWVLETLLNAPPPPPPPNVPELKEGPELKGTLRQRLEQHRSNAVCASCHERMDPIGFALEHFDALGAWRETDGKEPIDAAGVLAGGEAFDGAQELAATLRERKKMQFVQAFAEKLLGYALGRGIEFTDRCALDEITARAAQADFRFSAIVLGIVNSAPFQKMRTPVTPSGTRGAGGRN